MRVDFVIVVIAGLAIEACKSGSPSVATGPVEARSVLAVGAAHSCLLREDGKVRCWGDNSNGGLGDGTAEKRSAAVEVKGLGGFVSDVSAGGDHACAIVSGGTAMCWGANRSGQLGDGTTAGHTTPVAVAGLGAKAKRISAGGDHTCALLETGGIACWGGNSTGELGDGTIAPRAKPKSPSGIGVGIAGVDHTCAVETSGGLKCWGLNVGFMYASGAGEPIWKVPRAVSGSFDAKISRLVMGDGRIGVLTKSGSAYCWGGGLYGLCGEETPGKGSAVPVKVSWLGNQAVSLAFGVDHGCALLKGGAVRCWGGTSFGQLGNGSTEGYSLSPVQVPGLESGVAQIAAGPFHTCALLADGAVRCWGRNDGGELGDGTVENRSAPVAVRGI